MASNEKGTYREIGTNHFRNARKLRENGENLNWVDFLDSYRSTLSDQAGRGRASLPIPLGDYKLINDKLPFFFDTETNGTGAVDYNSTLKSHDMSTGADGDWAVVKTFQSHNYFAGKSQFVEITSFHFHDQDNVTKRLGYYSSSTTSPFTANFDGFFLESNGTEHRLRIINNGTEILNLSQSQWDDPLDGTGDSGYTINWETFNVFQFSFLWLGGTGLRFSIVVGSDIIQVHNYKHVGGTNADKLIFSSPNKPIRYEIRQDGTGSGDFDPVCATVITEGSSDSGSIGSIRAVDTGASDVVSASAGAEYILKGIRLKDAYSDVTIDLVDVDPFVESNNDFFLWRVQINPTLSATPTWADVSNSSVQHSTGDGDITVTSRGTVLASGFGVSRASAFSGVDSARKIGNSIAGVQDELWLTIEPIQGSTNLNSFATILYKEFI